MATTRGSKKDTSALPQPIPDLIGRFEQHADAYRSGRYSEAQLRHDFLDPFWEALGWDVHNRQGYAEAYRDVIYEGAIRVGGATKAPDYCFRIGGLRKFFLEAKKPSVDVKDDIHPAFQLRRYAWSAKLPLSVLSDFEELAVYDTRIRPHKNDSASAARVFYCTLDEYAEKWDWLSSIFGRDAVLRGSFDKFAEDKRVKRGTAAVDDAFLEEIESWRDVLARNLALRNTALTRRELNFAVQRIIDRIIFLRICEDRSIEDYGRLLALVNGRDIYERLCELFREADDRYNSGLFHFKVERGRDEPPDELTPGLRVDDKVLRNILHSLYYPESPYEFSVLPADILGQVYERFLGKSIRLTPSHRAVVEDKPEVRKAGGVYYTPTYIVDYIVKNTVGKILEGKTPAQAARLRILDPACGSGSFLIAAYQHLLAWYLDWYTANDPSKRTRGRSPTLVQVSGREWKLTIAERKRILLNNIFGVDIDSQAVEVTKLSLLLKVLEGETEQTLQPLLRFARERALPDLSSNIKCGNSLVGHEFYENAQMSMLDSEQQLRINAFDWRIEFPPVMKSGGFDAVIGNPPYLRIQGLQEYHRDLVNYFAARYKSAVKRFDLYLLFAERGYELLTEGGRLGFICPHKFLNSDFGSGLRRFMLDEATLESFVSFGQNLVFEQASTYTGILLMRKRPMESFRYYEFGNVPIRELRSSLTALSADSFAVYDFKNLSPRPWVLTLKENSALIRRLFLQAKTLEDVCDEILVGVQSGIDNVHVLRFERDISREVLGLFSERADGKVEIERELVKPFLRGEDVERYSAPRPTHYCIYPYRLKDGKTRIIDESELRCRYPLGYAYLKEYQRELAEIRRRQKTNPKYWYSCHRSRDMRLFESERIITPEISLGCNMTLAPAGLYHNTQVYSIVPSRSCQEEQLYWLGLLNSKVMWWFLTKTGNVLRGGYFRFKTNYLKPFPVHAIDFQRPSDKAHHDSIVTLSERMVELHRQQAHAKTPGEQKGIARQIAATDEQIDRLVYELYGLTETEIRVIEEST